jgi:hypothetical protein
MDYPRETPNRQDVRERAHSANGRRCEQKSVRVFSARAIRESSGRVNRIIAPPPITERRFDDYHLSTLDNQTTLLDRETKQVEFVRASDAKSTPVYVYDGSPLYFETHISESHYPKAESAFTRGTTPGVYSSLAKITSITHRPANWSASTQEMLSIWSANAGVPNIKSIRGAGPLTNPSRSRFEIARPRRSKSASWSDCTAATIGRSTNNRTGSTRWTAIPLSFGFRSTG